MGAGACDLIKIGARGVLGCARPLKWRRNTQGTLRQGKKEQNDALVLGRGHVCRAGGRIRHERGLDAGKSPAPPALFRPSPGAGGLQTPAKACALASPAARPSSSRRGRMTPEEERTQKEADQLQGGRRKAPTEGGGQRAREEGGRKAPTKEADQRQGGGEGEGAWEEAGSARRRRRRGNANRRRRSSAPRRRPPRGGRRRRRSGQRSARLRTSASSP